MICNVRGRSFRSVHGVVVVCRDGRVADDWLLVGRVGRLEERRFVVKVVWLGYGAPDERRELVTVVGDGVRNAVSMPL